MNIQQFQYVLAVADHRHFQEAANQCYISQSTLSTMIARLEQELGIKIFDRSTKPVSVTSEGKTIIEQLRIIVNEVQILESIAEEMKGSNTGSLKIGIIPTVAPFLMPLFLPEFAKQYDQLQIEVQEMTTAIIMEALKERTLDIGILALPLLEDQLVETTIYHEPFMLYDCNSEHINAEASIEDIDLDQLWLLQEGHCFRNQVSQMCNLSQRETGQKSNLQFKAGSIDSLIRFTKANRGITFLPQMATIDLSPADKSKLATLADPKPVRSIGIVVHRNFVKNRIHKSLVNIIDQKVHEILPRVDAMNILNPI